MAGEVGRVETSVAGCPTAYNSQKRVGWSVWGGGEDKGEWDAGALG